MEDNERLLQLRNILSEALSNKSHGMKFFYGDPSKGCIESKTGEIIFEWRDGHICMMLDIFKSLHFKDCEDI